ncbi:MAG: ABC transporter substrate-binding protein [Chloroflexi bacterium]|nr:ABC transporter substrate-binding protein [Chloroflexota bacterium]
MKLRLLLPLLGLFILLAACVASPSATQTATAGAATEPAALRIVTSFSVETLNPAEDGFWMPEFGVAEMLMQFRADGQYHPWLLEALTNTDDLTWQMTLRKGLTFQNGKPVDAAAVVACMTRQMKYSGTAQGSIPADVKFAVTGPLEITVKTSQPFPALPGALSNEDIFMIYDAAAVDAVGEDWVKLAGAGIYTGPYSVVSLNEQEMVLKRYEQYWQGKPALPGVSVRFVTDPSARLLAVQNDEADIALYPPTAAKPVVEKTPGVHFNFGTPGTGGFMFVMNLQTPPFNDLAVRKAIIKAVNYNELANTVFDKVFDSATGWYAPIFPWAVKNQQTDLPAATKLLDDAGWKTGADAIRVKAGQPLKFLLIIYPQQPDLVPASNAIQSQLKQLGIQVEIQSVDDINNAMLENTVPWNAGLISNSTTSWGIPEPVLRRYYTTDGDRNYGKFSNAEIDQLTEELSVTVDQAKRTAMLKRIQQIMIEEEPYAFNINFSKGRVIVNDRYQDYQPGFSLYHVSWQTQPAKGQ